MIDEHFIANRVTELRLKKGVSEYKMSMDMGHSSSYIHSIASGKTLPSMSEFLYMCDYLGVTPSQFFDETGKEVQELRTLQQFSEDLSKDDLEALILMAQRLCKKK